MKPTNTDYEYIARKINLPLAKTMSLCEEERDLNLVLNEVSKVFKKSEASELSYELYVKLVFLLRSQDVPFNLEEKIYVANAATEYINLLKSNKAKAPTREKSEQYSKYHFILAGLFDGKLVSGAITPKFLLSIENGFWDAGYRDVGKHLETWMNLMREIKREGWFKTPRNEK
jgi:hypothetical protein